MKAKKKKKEVEMFEIWDKKGYQNLKLERLFLMDLITLLKEDALNAKKKSLRHRGKNRGYSNGFDDGRAFAYLEVMSTMKWQLFAFQIKPKSVKFDIDPDKDLI